MEIPFLYTIALLVATTTNPTALQELQIKSAIEYAAFNNQVSQEFMLELADCESGYNIRSWNKLDPGLGSMGLFQFQIPTFYSTAKQYGLKNADIWNWEQQVKLTAYLLAQGKWKPWTNCSNGLFKRGITLKEKSR